MTRRGMILRGRAIAAARHRSGAPAGLSRCASQAKPLLTIAIGDSLPRALAAAGIIAAVVLGAVLA